MALNENGTRMFMNLPSRRGPRTGLVTLCVTFSERELIPSYNRLRDRYGKLLLRYLGCLGDHQSTGAGGDATVLKRGMRARVRVRVSIRQMLSVLFLFFSVENSQTSHHI